MKKPHCSLLWFLILVVASCAATQVEAGSVTLAGYTNDFSSLPSASDWSYFDLAGANSTIASTSDMDTQIAALSASSIGTQLTTDSANNPPTANAFGTWSSLGQYIQTRPTGNAASIIMCTLVNNLGNDAASVTLSYDFTKAAVLTEEIDGHRAYYSLSGAANTWAPIPEFSSASPGRLTATLTVLWPSGSSLYVLWADDNSVASSPDTAMQIDNFSAIAISAAQVPVSITNQPQDRTVEELTPVSFSVGASGIPAPTFQWYKNNSVLTNATNATLNIAAAAYSDNGAQFQVVAANTASNVYTALTSSVAVLTVIADTNPPVANYDPAPGSTVLELSFLNVAFNKAVVGVDASDLLINGVGATSVKTNNPGDFTFYFTQPATGTVQVAWDPNHAITDATTHANPFGGGSWTYALIPTPQANVVISEFMTDNGTGIKDEDGNHSDWIELLNVSTLQVNLDGWFLTDDPANLTKWQFPVGTQPLQGNSYMIVWASGKNRTNPLAPLHTNFKLAKEAGNYLALVDASTNIASVFASYPLQQTDVSYGRDTVDPNIVGYFFTPTPGQQNSTAGVGFVSDPIFSVASGIYTNDSLTLTLSMSNAPVGSTIRYTVNGTMPTNGAPAYTAPITFTTNLIIKARVYPPTGTTNLFPGQVVVGQYLFLDVTVKDFNSELPILILSHPGIGVPQGIPPGGTRPEGIITIINTTYGRSSIRATPDFFGLAGLEIFGQTSAGEPKPPVRIETHDAYANDLHIPILGMPADSDWKMRNPYEDKTLMNDFLGYELWGEMGHYTCRGRFVEAFTNSVGRLQYPRDYVGVEVIFESIKVGKDRVNIPSITPFSTNYPAITGGYIFKKDKDSTGDLNFTTAGGNAGAAGTFAGQALKLHEPKVNDLRTTPGVTTSWPGTGYTAAGSNQMTYLVSYLNQLETALYATNWLATNVVGTTNHYANYLDVTSFADFQLVVEFTRQIDGVRLSDYFTKDRNGKVQAGPVWDWNRSLGNANYIHGGQTDGWYFASQDKGVGPTEEIWLRRLINGNANMGAVNQDNSGNALGPGGDPDFDQAMVDRWSIFRTNVLNGTNVLQRIDQLATNLNEAALRDSWSSTGRYRGTIVGRAVATNPDGNLNGQPATNTAGIARTWDVDYVHPTNYLGGDTNSIIWQMKKWVLGRYLWIDGQFTPTPRLSAYDGQVPSGYNVSLIPPPGATLYYTLDGTDPRMPGGGILPTALTNSGPTNLIISSNVRIFARAKQPTNLFYNTWSGPAAATVFTAIPPLRITEIMYHPSPPPPPFGSTNSAEDFEFIELKNTGNTPLNVNRFTLDGGVQFQFPNVVLAAGQSAVVVANVAAFQSRYGSNIFILGTYTGHLNNAGDHLLLSGPTQEPILDFSFQDGWYPVTDGLGFSLVTVNEQAPTSAWNDAANWQVGSVLGGSPGQNDPPPPPRPAIVVNEVLSSEDPPDGDAIELLNSTGDSVDISGWFLSDNINVPKKFVVPPGTILPPGGFVVFYATNSFGVGVNAFGLNASGDQVYLFSGNGADLTGYLHGLDFGVSAKNVSFGRYVISTGADQLVAQVSNSFGATNAGPLVGPIVVSEIQYHPPELVFNGVAYDNTNDEFIELQNISTNDVLLYDPAFLTNTWHVRDAVDYHFPTNAVLPAGGFLLVVNFDPATNPVATASFRARNSVPPTLPLYGPWLGYLDNGNARVELARPDVPATNGVPYVPTNGVPYVLVERVHYFDSAPWPGGADGFGLSLQRIVPASFGDDPINWMAAVPAPGTSYMPSGAPPVISNQPGDARVPIGNDVLLSVSASGTGPLHYQWRANGVNLPGATNSLLSLPNFQSSQSGTYKVVVYNDSGSASGTNFSLLARTGLKITGQPTTRAAMNGTSTNFTITATGTGFLRYQWRFNSNNIAGAVFPTLTLNNLQASDQGTYDCVVGDDIDTLISLPATLFVAYTANYTQHPLSQSVVSNSTVTFTASASGSLPMSFRWLRSIGNLPANSFVVAISNYSFLTFTNVTTANAGTYYVVITNLAGPALGSPGGGKSSNAFLTVLVDSDGDGLPDAWETNSALHPLVTFNPNDPSDGVRDDDGDGMSNAAEYFAGTDPFDPSSNLRLSSTNGLAIMQFVAVSNRTYTVQYTDGLKPSHWQKLADILGKNFTRIEPIVDPNPHTNRFYRILTPIQP